MNVLIACEFSGTVRDAFLDRGHNAWSCDTEETTSPGPHIRGDLCSVLRIRARWDLLIAHPPCTYICSSGLHWNRRDPERQEKTELALQFVELIMSQDIERIAIENPVGCISTRIDARRSGFRTQKATQYIQPYEFGEDASKKTGLWLKNLPDLQPTKRIKGRIVIHNGNPVERWSNQTDSGQNRLGPSETRSAERATTYPGIADAFVNQWSDLK